MKVFLIKRILLAGFVFTLSCYGNAAEWKQIFKNPNTEIYVDQSTLKTADNEKTITVKNNAIQGDKSPSSLELKYFINCSSKTFALVSATQFRAIDLQGEGTVLKVTTPPVVTYPNPGSVGELYVKVSCESLKPPISSASSPPQQSMPNNFLINMCALTGEENGAPPLTSCKLADLRSRPIFVTPGTIFSEKSVVIFVIPGLKANGSNSKEMRFEYPASYSMVSPSEIVVSVSGAGGCIISEKYIKQGNEIYQEYLPARGTCSDVQLRANKAGMQDGRQKIPLIRSF